MNAKQTWEEIEQQYDQQWVELIDYDWPEQAPYPVSGRIRVHAADRKEFDRLINQDPPLDSAILFVGERKLEPGVIFSANLHQWKIGAGA